MTIESVRNTTYEQRTPRFTIRSVLSVLPWPAERRVAWWNRVVLRIQKRLFNIFGLRRDKILFFWSLVSRPFRASCFKFSKQSTERLTTYRRILIARISPRAQEKIPVISKLYQIGIIENVILTRQNILPLIAIKYLTEINRLYDI